MIVECFFRLWSAPGTSQASLFYGCGAPAAKLSTSLVFPHNSNIHKHCFCQTPSCHEGFAVPVQRKLTQNGRTNCWKRGPGEMLGPPGSSGETSRDDKSMRNKLLELHPGIAVRTHLPLTHMISSPISSNIVENFLENEHMKSSR